MRSSLLRQLLSTSITLAAVSSAAAADAQSPVPPAEAPAPTTATPPAPGEAPPAPAEPAPGAPAAPPTAAPPQPGYPPPGAYPPGPYYGPGAQPYPPPGGYAGYPPGQGMYVQTPPPPPAGPPPGHHLHDGFYLRMSLGAGYQRSKITSDASGVSDVAVKGGGVALDLMMGGTPTPGLVIGGGIFASSAADPTLESDGVNTELRGDTSIAIVGPFIDGFFDPEGGFHVGGAIGIGSLTVRDEELDTSETQYDGAGVAAWVGYDAWVSSEWSMGGCARVVAASGKRDEDVLGVTVSEESGSVGFALLFTALYH